MMQMNILDVGCGSHPRGDVNVDVLGTLSNVSNFVCADSQHLPFRNKMFERAVSFHAIEHVDNPMLMIEEMKRVVNGGVFIVTPFAFSYDLTRLIRISEHKHWFFSGFFKKLGFSTRVKVIWRRPTICNKLFPLFFPFIEIEANS